MNIIGCMPAGTTNSAGMPSTDGASSFSRFFRYDSFFRRAFTDWSCSVRWRRTSSAAIATFSDSITTNHVPANSIFRLSIWPTPSNSARISSSVVSAGTSRRMIVFLSNVIAGLIRRFAASTTTSFESFSASKMSSILLLSSITLRKPAIL